MNTQMESWRKRKREKEKETERQRKREEGIDRERMTEWNTNYNSFYPQYSPVGAVLS